MVMTNNSRPDIIESKILDSKYDLDSISFNETQWIFHDFMKDVFLPKISLENKISDRTKAILKKIMRQLGYFWRERSMKRRLTK